MDLPSGQNLTGFTWIEFAVSESISHAFPSRAEVQAYLVGAQFQWPQEVSRDASNGRR